MSSKVTIDAFAAEIEKLLKEDKEQTEDLIIKRMDQVEDVVLKKVEATSPKRGGKYAKSWRVKKEQGRLGQKRIISNKIYRLTHLLENGHFKFNQHGGPFGNGRTAAQPHIAPAQDLAEQEFFNGITKDLENK